ncbi:ABC transporter permease [Phytomonospora endophytica]|uniref:Putative aldouronate transport system permease protein n=1 Tax=Phytomonospora endophytica TaxID=714109 RepID=A0A841F9A7_9ACTN|nr:ABC transporter permease subunit [Phytomonospora endophytica]MBB6032334.1 putative aldouronate transport system permease protein [Phytomonospora endophytica]GIG68682.1 polysaccharide ABC transporter ATP-binding protein [Phytomonospora endophytica]
MPTITDERASGAAPVTAAPAVRRRRRTPLAARLRRDWPLLAMTVPAAGLLVVFHYIPTLWNAIAFQDYNPYAGVGGSAWVGLGTFERMLSDPGFWDATVNTLALTGFQLVFFFPIPIALALLLNSVLSRRVRKVMQSVVYLPHFFSWVLVISFFEQMLGGAGLLAQEMRELGMEPLNIMNNPETFPLLVTAQSVWMDAGWGMIVFLAALSAINPSLYEAAASDGAGRRRRLWHVTLPGLRPVIVLLLILKLGNALSVGFEQFLIQRDAVGAGAAEVLDTYVYFQGVVVGDLSYGAAAGIFKGVVGLVLILVANRVAHALGEQGVYSKQ